MTSNTPLHAGGVADPHLMLAFDQPSIPTWLADRLHSSDIAGVSLFREWNIESSEQTAELTSELQRLNAGPLPLLIAADQEGGQLLSLVGSTPFAGNMAIGATGDADLAYRVALAIGRELRSVGINVNYAPAVDVATQAMNPSLGIRSFGDDPAEVARLGAATVSGLSDAGILSGIKHFPGKGEALVDPHFDLPYLDQPRDRIDSVELPPFAAAMKAGARILMMGHYLVPAITDSTEVPISASEKGIDGLARTELGFSGIVITDALDMGALDQGPAQVVEIIAMMRAGTDLLLCMPDPDLQERVRQAVERGYSRGLIPESTLSVSRDRITSVRSSIAPLMLDPSVVGNSEHHELANELARRSITLVRNEDGLVPLQLGAGAWVLVLEPEPSDITPADTTSRYPPGLATALREHHQDVSGIVYPHSPGVNDIEGARTAAMECDLLVVGTDFANEDQASLVEALLATGCPTVTVALRTPFDLAMYPTAPTHICTYGSHTPSMEAVAKALFGRAAFPGRLPAAIPGLYPTGHGEGG